MMVCFFGSYDIVNITMYEGKYKQDMAMAIDDNFTYSLSVYDFLEFLKLNSVSRAQYFEYFGDMLKKNFDVNIIDIKNILNDYNLKVEQKSMKTILLSED